MQVPGGSIYLMSTYFSSSKVLVVVGSVGTSINCRFPRRTVLCDDVPVYGVGVAGDP